MYLRGMHLRTTHSPTDRIPLSAVPPIHHDRVQPPHEGPPNPGGVRTRRVEVVRIRDDHLAAVRRGRVVPITSPRAGRDPIRWAVGEVCVRTRTEIRILKGHADGMLL